MNLKLLCFASQLRFSIFVIHQHSGIGYLPKSDQNAQVRMQDMQELLCSGGHGKHAVPGLRE